MNMQQNFRVTIGEITSSGSQKQIYQVRVHEPPKVVKLKRIRKQYELVNKDRKQGLDLELEQANVEQYRLVHTVRDGLRSDYSMQEDLSEYRAQREYSV